jgi:hypothetical protein
MATMAEVKDWYLRLPNSQKQRFLAAVGLNLTISFRHSKPGNLNPKSWFGVNELHQALYGTIDVLGSGIDDKIVWDHILVIARQYNLTGTLTSTLESAKEAMTLVAAMGQKAAK